MLNFQRRPSARSVNPPPNSPHSSADACAQRALFGHNRARVCSDAASSEIISERGVRDFQQPHIIHIHFDFISPLNVILVC